MPEVQRCYLCDQPTGRTTEDELRLTCEKGPDIVVCEECFDDAEREEPSRER